MSETPSTQLNRRYIFCNNCGNETNHTLQSEHFRDYPNYNPDRSLGFVERVGHRFWICAGCERGTLEEYYIFDITDEQQDEEIGNTYYPGRFMLHVKKKGFIKLPKTLDNIYRETLRAFNEELHILCAIGIRALLEGICSDKLINGRNLEARIDNLTTILPQNIVSHLHSIRFIGNEAAHELSPPATEELKLAIEICEDLLNYLYELDYKTSQLKTSHEKRKLRLKSPKKSP